MQQLSITYFFPLTEQIELDLDYAPCLKYEEDKRKNSTFIGNRIDQWGVYPDGAVTMCNTLVNPKLVLYPESMPITIRTKDKPSVLTRWIYKILGVMWEKA